MEGGNSHSCYLYVRRVPPPPGVGWSGRGGAVMGAHAQYRPDNELFWTSSVLLAPPIMTLLPARAARALADWGYFPLIKHYIEKVPLMFRFSVLIHLLPMVLPTVQYSPNTPAHKTSAKLQVRIT